MSLSEVHNRSRRRDGISKDSQSLPLRNTTNDGEIDVAQKKMRKSRSRYRIFLSLCLVLGTFYLSRSFIHFPLFQTPHESLEIDDIFRNETKNDKLVNGQQKPHHKIPHILVFTYQRNLLVDAADLLDEEEKVLSDNVRHSIDLHSKESTVVRFLTDDDCIKSLQKVFPSLVPFFKNETKGMFKADMCRGSALYETGGIYLDVDLGVRKDLWLDLLPTTEFVTSFVHLQSKYPKHFFQAILGAAPRSQILYKYLQLFWDHYTKKNTIKGPLGVILLRKAWDAVYDDTLKLPATELYQEVLYHKKLFPDLYPAPTWGTRRACHFVVVAKAHSPKHAEMTSESGTSFHIPLYSRIPGSRMCPKQNVTTAKSHS